MDDSASPRRDVLTLPAIDPNTGIEIEVKLRHNRVITLGRRSVGAVKTIQFLVPFSLKLPTAIFEGLREEQDEDKEKKSHASGWRCYCGVPPRRYTTDGSEVNASPKQVFLVFVNDERIIYNWYWSEADGNDDKLPVDYKARFRKRLL